MHLLDSERRNKEEWEAAGIELPKLNLALNGKRRFTFEEYTIICGVLKVNTDKFLKPRLPEEKAR